MSTRILKTNKLMETTQAEAPLTAPSPVTDSPNHVAVLPKLKEEQEEQREEEQPKSKVFLPPSKPHGKNPSFEFPVPATE